MDRGGGFVYHFIDLISHLANSGVVNTVFHGYSKSNIVAASSGMDETHALLLPLEGEDEVGLLDELVSSRRL